MASQSTFETYLYKLFCKLFSNWTFSKNIGQFVNIQKTDFLSVYEYLQFG